MARSRLPSLLALAALAAWGAPLSGQIQPEYEWSGDRPDAVGPIGVTNERTYEEGHLGLSYRFVGMKWNGNKAGTNPVSLAQVLDLFFVAPTQAEAAMHLVGIGYAPSERVTLEGQLPFLIYKAATKVTQDGRQYEEDAGIWDDGDRYGFGDAKLRGHLQVYSQGPYRAHASMGVSVPLGSFYQSDLTPLSPTQERRSGYPLQIGSGTWDVLPGFTVMAMNESAATGIQGKAILRMHENELNYRLGHRFEGSVWGAYQASDLVSVSARIEALHWGDVSGADPALQPNLDPTENPGLQGGTAVNLPLGVNVLFREGVLEGHRVGFEASLPIYQNLNGPQLSHDWTLTLGWQYLMDLGDDDGSEEMDDGMQ